MLESATGPLADSPGRFAIVPGAPERSELLRRVSSTNPDFVMPPPRTHLALTKAEIALLERWIEEGAEYQRHWAFIRRCGPACRARSTANEP